MCVCRFTDVNEIVESRPLFCILGKMVITINLFLLHTGKSKKGGH